VDEAALELAEAVDCFNVQFEGRGRGSPVGEAVVRTRRSFFRGCHCFGGRWNCCDMSEGEMNGRKSALEETSKFKFSKEAESLKDRRPGPRGMTACRPYDRQVPVRHVCSNFASP
jgi:hypothetical protein